MRDWKTANSIRSASSWFAEIVRPLSVRNRSSTRFWTARTMMPPASKTSANRQLTTKSNMPKTTTVALAAIRVSTTRIASDVFHDSVLKILIRRPGSFSRKKGYPTLCRRFESAQRMSWPTRPSTQEENAFANPWSVLFSRTHRRKTTNRTSSLSFRLYPSASLSIDPTTPPCIPDAPSVRIDKNGIRRLTPAPSSRPIEIAKHATKGAAQ